MVGDRDQGAAALPGRHRGGQALEAGNSQARKDLEKDSAHAGHEPEHETAPKRALLGEIQAWLVHRDRPQREKKR